LRKEFEEHVAPLELRKVFEEDIAPQMLKQEGLLRR